MQARPVIDHLFRDFPTSCRSQHRDETVTLAVQFYVIENFAAVKLQAAIVIMQFHAGEPTDQPIEKPGRQTLVERVFAVLLPTADQVVAFVQQLNHRWQFCWVVLQVGVHRHDQLTGRIVDAGLKC